MQGNDGSPAVGFQRRLSGYATACLQAAQGLRGCAGSDLANLQSLAAAESTRRN